MLDSIGSAAESATKAATDNPLGSAIDSLAGALGAKPAAAGADGTARFTDGEAIGAKDDPTTHRADPKSDGQPQDTPATLDVPKPVQFLHLAWAHDDKPDQFAGKDGSDGKAFREALIREDLLLYSFASGAKAVVKAGADSKGAAGALLDAASSLMGGSSEAPPGPESFDPILSQIRAAGDSINLESFDYPTIHKAGLDLGKATDALNEAAKKALTPGSGGGLGLSSIPGLSSIMGGAGIPDIIAKVPEWLFKVQDAYAAMYREARKAYEWELMKVSHDLSIQAIEGKWLPGYDIWRFRSDEATQAAFQGNPSFVEQKLAEAQQMLQQKYITLQGKGLGPTDTGPGKDANKAVGKAQEAMAKARQTGEDKAGDLVGLLDTAKDLQADCPPEAVAALAAAFKIFEADPKTGRDPLSKIMGNALGSALLGDGKPCPGPLQFVVDYSCGANVAVLTRIYQYLQAMPTAPDERLILTAVYDAVGTKLINMLLGLFGMQPPKGNDNSEKKDKAKSVVDDVGTGDFSKAMSGAGGLVPSKEEGINKAADLVMALLKKEGHLLDGILTFLSHEIWQELFGAYMEAEAKNAMTMEVYLGRLPMLVALVERDLIFPVFNLLMKAFGLADKLAGKVWDPVSKGIGKVGDVATSVKDKKDDVKKAGQDAHAAADRLDTAIDQKESDLQQKAGQLGNMDSSASSLDDLEQIAKDKQNQANSLGNEIGSTPDDMMKAIKGNPDGGDPSVPKKADGAGPISAPRKAKGEGQKVTGSQVDDAGRETPVAEKDILDARNKPPPAAKKSDSKLGAFGL